MGAWLVSLTVSRIALDGNAAETFCLTGRVALFCGIDLGMFSTARKVFCKLSPLPALFDTKPSFFFSANRETNCAPTALHRPLAQ